MNIKRKKSMTTTKTIKNEILSNLAEIQPCCKVAFLSALFRSAGSIVINNLGLSVSVASENLKLVNLLSDIVEEMYGVKCPVSNTPNPIKNTKIYTVAVRDKNILKETGILAEVDGLTEIIADIDPYIVSEECCAKSYITGLFIGCGVVTLPSLKEESKKINAGYHFEFFLSSISVAEDLVALLASKGFKFKTSSRSEGTVVYVKDSATISDVLAYMGANKAVLGLQNLLIEKDCRNNANRQSNCITANIGKSINASEKQLADIDYVVSQKGWEYFSDQLKAVALARRQNPSANLSELASICGGDLTKSGVAHRLRKIAQMAKKLGKTD